ncbi:apolipoprotein N-acyltransferase [Ancylomarina longa]|uniref:Apolipoprotein N-acyltransferase n=1 Tax=Ancylomarina longa TaxID=2487017 RepID=A0A434AFP2_9BACT|nr:apolipoprotein N-acyltransferase [Ancylomarina longa]RUT73194.1 apolipoprotein N-acyltransferase [Ancylomarina longa]
MIPKVNKNILLAIASGILLGIPFCIPALFFLIFIAWIPLLILEDKLQNHPNSYLLFNYSLICFLIWNAMAYWWVGKAQLFGVILIIILNALILSLVFWLISKTRKMQQIPILFPFLIIWLGFEYFHTQWELAFPWLNLGNAFASAPKWMQWYEFTGTRGGSLWIIIVNIACYAAFVKSHSIRLTNIIGVGLIIAIPLTFSNVIFHQPESKISTRSFVLIQPNLDPYTEKFVPEQEEKHFSNFLSQADSLCQSLQPDYLFGPETLILDYIKENKPNKSSYFNRLLALKKKYPKTNFLIGVQSEGSYNDKKESYNSALFLADTIPAFYHKTKLVPLFESMPFNRYLGFLNDYALEIGGYKGTYSSRNSTASFYSNDSVALTPIVCFESIFGDYCAQRVPAKPGFICMITNDGWWKNTPGYQYHFHYSQIRAIESRRQYIRIANNGISALINAKGKIISQTKWWQPAILSGNVSLEKKATFYSQHGDFIGRICLFFAILLLIFVKIQTYTQQSLKRTN